MPTETPTAETTIVDELPKELSLIVQQNALQPATATSLQESFAPIFNEARGVIEKSRGIVVTDASQTLDMKVARQYRLALKEIRVRSDKRRKELKDESLRTGRAIDAFHNILLHLTETEEKRLQDQEDFVERKEQQRKAALTEQRTQVLVGLQIDPALYQLGEMSEETFQQLVEGTKLARQAESERRRKEEADRIEREQKEAAERERIRQENERLKKEAEEKEAALKTERERVAAEKAAADEKARIEREALEKKHAEERRIAEEKAATERKKLEAEKKAAAEKARIEREALEKKHAEERRIAEEKAATERKKLEAEKKAAAEKARREREAAEQKAAEEKAAREKVEKQLREQREAEERRVAAANEMMRKAAALPDKEKIVQLAKALDVTIPDMVTTEGKAVIERFMVKQHELIQWLREEYKRL